MMQILVATKNAGKVRELTSLLNDLPLRLRSLNDFPDVGEAVESGATFAENARLKAEFYALETGLWSLADDSGLAVEALGGAPGVFSARYAGEEATDEENIEKLLGALNKKTNPEERRARFVCAMAMCDAQGAVKYTGEASCDGTISAVRSGANGFGYDPIFIPDGFGQTFGEFPREVKRKISHRARAAEKIIQYLRSLTADLT